MNKGRKTTEKQGMVGRMHGFKGTWIPCFARQLTWLYWARTFLVVPKNSCLSVLACCQKASAPGVLSLQAVYGGE
jgi:hypothetical protein